MKRVRHLVPQATLHLMYQALIQPPFYNYRKILTASRTWPPWYSNAYLYGLAPDYLTSKFTERNTGYELRDSENQLYVRLLRPHYFKNSFSYSGATLWNSLPCEAICAESLTCCKAHDFCELDLVQPAKCGGNFFNLENRFEYNASTDTCTPASEYDSNDVEVGKCAGGLCKTKADVIVLIQDSRSISEGIRSSIQCIVRTLLTSLNSDDTDYKFVMGRYGSKTKMNSWGSAASAIYYVNYEYLKGGLGPYNRLNRVLKKKVPMKFDERSAYRKGKDPAKIVVLFTDGNTEDGDGRLLDTFKLLNAEKVLRVDNEINLVGALIPNVNNTQRIDQLKSIVSEPNDAINVGFTEANLNKIADRLAFRVRRLLVCRGTDGKMTEEQLLTAPETTQGVSLSYEFSDIDVGGITEVRIRSDRRIQGQAGWELRKVEVTKGDQTVTAVFNENIGAFDSSWKSGRGKYF
ncbi:hypothetical protein pdam_00011902 [Pocillopora damicornis]|uniref:VWFA domain-containing protein n=1 Tax=Pocillopora damicornis TaxID=46731 RepID=A0A3M6V0C6_POCDA|nr:hypothetical protein pdam_00011902 [Pocillopora damicornis]